MTPPLKEQSCTKLSNTDRALDRVDVDILLGSLDEDWHCTDNGLQIERVFHFKGFQKTMGFTNAIAWIANNEMHHPTLELSYSYCKVCYTTNDVNGLSMNDFICAAKIDQLLKKSL